MLLTYDRTLLLIKSPFMKFQSDYRPELIKNVHCTEIDSGKKKRTSNQIIDFQIYQLIRHRYNGKRNRKCTKYLNIPCQIK